MAGRAKPQNAGIHLVKPGAPQELPLKKPPRSVGLSSKAEAPERPPAAAQVETPCTRKAPKYNVTFQFGVGGKAGGRIFHEWVLMGFDRQDLP